MKNKEQYIFPFLERLLDGAEVEWKKLGEVCEIKGRIGFRGYTRNDLVEKGEGAITLSPSNIINQQLSFENCSYISWVKYEESPEIKVELNDVIFTKTASVGKTALVKTLPQEATINPQLVLLKRIKCIPDYLAYILQNDYFQQSVKQLTGQGSVPNVPQSSLAKILIPIPPLSVQRKLVEILDKFTELEAELEAELDCRKRQYEYYRNKLLTFDMLNTPPEKLNNVITMSLGEVGTFTRGSGLQKKDFTPTGVGCIHYGQIYTYYGTYAYKTKSFVSQKFAQKARKAKYGDLIIATTSENDEDVCKAVAWLGEKNIAISSDACFYTHTMNPKYIAYYFQTELFQKQKKKFITGTKVRRINTTDLAKIKIPLPPLSEQQRIVDILDKFDTLTSSISEGLPKEIELRRKQYEYYREQLLSFRH